MLRRAQFRFLPGINLFRRPTHGELIRNEVERQRTREAVVGYGRIFGLQPS
jgi:hypothetical protein